MKSHGWVLRLTAWLVSFMLIGVGTAAGVAGVQALTPPLPPGARGASIHVHGLIVAMEANETFAVRVPGRKAWLWMRCASDARISIAHLERHLIERAPTDVFYEVGPHGVLLANYAD